MCKAISITRLLIADIKQISVVRIKRYMRVNICYTWCSLGNALRKLCLVPYLVTNYTLKS
jgi:hypothetical protein